MSPSDGGGILNGPKSILLNTLLKREDPNSGSISLQSSDQLREKRKKDRRVKIVIDKLQPLLAHQRIDTEDQAGGGDEYSGDLLSQPPKLKGVLKRYDPNAPSNFPDGSDSP